MGEASTAVISPLPGHLSLVAKLEKLLERLGSFTKGIGSKRKALLVEAATDNKDNML